MRNARFWLTSFLAALIGIVCYSGSPAAPVSSAELAGSGYALQFYGNGVNDIDRVKVRIDPPVPADVGGDLTIEFWMKTTATGGSCTPGASGDGWITGRTIIDRDVYGNGDHGDYGISLANGRMCFGVERGSSGRTIYGSTNVANGQWRHIAVTRRASDGQVRIFVDGQLDAQGSGPTGDISYRDGRPTIYPNSDPFLVIGAEKHDISAAYPSYIGLLDDVRISNVVRHDGAFTRPNAPHAADGDTVALYRFDEGSGMTIIDSAPGGASPGVRRFGGSPAGPVYVTDTPFNGSLLSPTLTRTAISTTVGTSPTATATATTVGTSPTATAIATTVGTSPTATVMPSSTTVGTPTASAAPTATPFIGAAPLKLRAFLPLVQRP